MDSRVRGLGTAKNRLDYDAAWVGRGGSGNARKFRVLSGAGGLSGAEITKREKRRRGICPSVPWTQADGSTAATGVARQMRCRHSWSRGWRILRAPSLRTTTEARGLERQDGGLIVAALPSSLSLQFRRSGQRQEHECRADRSGHDAHRQFLRREEKPAKHVRDGKQYGAYDGCRWQKLAVQRPCHSVRKVRHHQATKPITPATDTNAAVASAATEIMLIRNRWTFGIAATDLAFDALMSIDSADFDASPRARSSSRSRFLEIEHAAKGVCASR